MRDRWIKASLVLLLALTMLLAGTLFALDAGYLRAPFIRFLSSQANRTLDIHGELHVHLLTRNPSIEAHQVVIANPPWSKAGTLAEISRMNLVLAPLFSGGGLEGVELDGAEIHLSRDSDARANWQRQDPDKSEGGSLPLLRELKLSHTHITLKDDRLHLTYDGSLSIAGESNEHVLLIEGTGQLNGHEASFLLKGQPLTEVRAGKPYAFEFEERSSGVHLTVKGSLPEALDLSKVDATFAASGADLRDLYFLTGASLPNTGKFEAQGHIDRQDMATRFDSLKVRSGDSDIAGSVTLSSPQDGRTQVDVQLTAELLRLADVGLRAAGRDPYPDAPPKVFTDVQLITGAARRVDLHGKLNVHHLKFARIEVDELTAPFEIASGRIGAHGASGKTLGGTLRLDLDANANQDPAEVQAVLTLRDVQLAQIPHAAAEVPYEGAMEVRVQVQGHGNSPHQVAATANGTLQARIKAGKLRAALAEMIGVDVRGLGLMLTRSDREVAVRCANLDFDIHAGIMQPTHFIIDSEPVSITARGRVLLDPETLDLKLLGTPKKTRLLHLGAPVLVEGTMLQPKFRLDLEQSKVRLVESGKEPQVPCVAEESDPRVTRLD